MSWEILLKVQEFEMDKSDFKVLITGDFYGGVSINGCRTDKQIRLNDFLPFIQASNLAITNLESPILDSDNIKLTEKIPKTGPHISSEPNVVPMLKEIGFNLVTLANNHIMDFGVIGLGNTIKALKNYSIDYIGAGLSREERRKAYFFEHSGNRVAILNFCENEWSTSNNEQAGANPLDMLANYQDISFQKEISDIVIVILHGGNEFYNLPSPKFRDTCRLFIQYGADYVFCHHTHTFSGYEHYRDGQIFYGLGNFYFPKNKTNPNDPWYYGFAVQLSFKNRQSHLEIIPYYQNSNKGGVRLLTSEESEDFFLKIKGLNEVIANDNQIVKMFEEYSLRVSKQYLSYLQPFGNRYLSALVNRGLLPPFLSKKKQLLLLNLIRCESHHALVVQLLKKNIK